MNSMNIQFLLTIFKNSKNNDNIFKQVLLDSDDNEILRDYINLNFNNTENLKIEKDYFVIKGELFRYYFIPLLVINGRFFEIKERKLDLE